MERKRRTPRIRRYDTTEYQREALRVLSPPEDLSVSEWAAKYRMLEAKTSAMPGPWRNDKTPYLKGVMDEFLNYDTEEIFLCKCTQVGGTEAMQNMIGYIIQQDPSTTIIVYPTQTLAESISKNRLQPMIQACRSLRKLWNEDESTKTELQFENMYLKLVGSNSPSDLASMAARYIFLDEVDKYPGASKKEADPIALVRERFKTYTVGRKLYMTSTPTLRTGHIWKALEGADIEKHYFVPCPFCGSMIELKFKQIKFPEGEDLSISERAEQAVYVCQECGCCITDQYKPKMLRYGEWKVVRQNGTHCRKVAFWINTLYSPFVRFSEIVSEFLTSKDDPEKLQNFVNSWLAEPWEDTKLNTSADLVLARQTELPEFTVPDWAVFLTGGVDVQENCLYWVIRAWGPHITSQLVARGQALDFFEVERVMNLAYEKSNGEQYVVNLGLVDSGYSADDTYDFCTTNAEWALPVKGSNVQMQTHYKISKINKVNQKTSEAYGITLVLVDGDKYKDMIAGRMARENGRGSWMVFNGCDQEYAEQVTAEHKVNVKTGGRVVQKWVPKRSHIDNHYLDAEVYAMAAADMLGVRSLHLEMEAGIREKAAKRQSEMASTEEPYSPEETWIQRNESWMREED